MLAVQFRTTGTRTMLAGECPLIGAPISEWASRLEDGASPLRIAAMPSRFSFARSSTYRKGSPRYRRAFSAYVNSLYMRHADDARVSSAQPACGRCSRGSAPSSAPGGASRTEPPLRMSATPSKFSFTEAEYVRLALRTMFAVPLRYSRLADDARGGVPPLQRLGALRGRSTRSASPLCRRGSALLQAQLAQIAFRNRLHLV